MRNVPKWAKGNAFAKRFFKWLRKKNNPALLTGDAVFTKVSSRGFTFVYMGPDMENRASHLYQGMDFVGLFNQKTDAEDQTPLANVEFELKNKETEEVVGKLTTDKDGVATSELLPIATYEDGKAVGPITYVLSETKPLEGYEEHTETYEITFSYVDAKTKVIEVVKEIQNKKLPQTPEKPEDVKTGDNTMLLLPIGIAVVAAFGIGIVLWRIRRTKR